MLERLEQWQEEAEARREELLRAHEAGWVADPITGTIFTMAFLKAVLVSTAISVGTSLLTRALTPRQKFTSGQLQGALQVPQSDQGLPITEGYGADPASAASPFQPSHAYALEDRVVAGGYFYVVTTAGTSAGSAPTFPATKGASVTSGTAVFTNYGRTGGGFRLPMLVVWTSGIRKHDEKVQGNGGGKGPKPPEQTVRTYDLDLAVMPGRGPLTVKRVRANTDTIYRNYDGGTAYYEAEAATKTGGAANTSDVLASGGVAVTIPQNGAVEWTAVGGDGTAAILEFYLATTSTVTVEMTWVGGAGTTVFTTNISSTGGVYRFEYGSAPWLLNSGSGNSVKVKNLSADALVMDRLGVRLSGGATGVPDTGIEPDDDYDHNLPQTPNTPYGRPLVRFSGELAEDSEGVKTGSVLAGSYSNIAIYPGNQDQLPDPTIQAAVDAIYGADSTPAFRGRCLVVLTNFYLTNYGGAIPLIQTLAEHQTVDTFKAFCDEMCGRTGVLESADYNFSGVRRLFCRGFTVTPPYVPADVMEELARVYNVYFVESDKIYAYERNSQAVVAALTSDNLGWVDGDADDEEGELASLDFDLATETEIARRYEITAVDPERDFEQNSQGTSRQITSSEKVEKTELALTLYPEEMREFTQRELYEEHVESTKHRLDLDWSYLWLQPGDSVTVVEDDGTTSRVFIESFRPNVGVCPAEGFAEETAVYSQPVSTSGGGVFEIPPVPIPGMTIVSFYDGPALRTEDEERPGFYAWVVKRVGDGDFPGATLIKMVEGEPQVVMRFDTQATAGKVVTKLGDVSDTDVEDGAKTFTADAGTDTVTATAHGFEDGETVMASSAGTIPAGLSASTLYYVRDSAANTFKVALTAGGSAVDITSAGTGTHSVQRVIEVDLHDQETVLESVTSDQIANGANPCLFGNEVVQVRTWELVAGFDRRWRGRNFTRGLRGSQPYTSSHVAGERFVLLDSAVKFIAQDIGELNTEREYRAVTSGQSLDDAAAIDFAWTGGTLKYPPPGIEATLDSTTDDWRLRIYGVETRDPEGELYYVRIVGGRDFNLRGAASRPASLSTTSAISDAPPPPGKGSYRVADSAGNSVTGPALRYVIQLLQGERTALSATYRTTLDETDSPADNTARLHFTSGALWGLTMWIEAATSTESPSLWIEDNISGTLFTDSDGEATGTRYTVEFRDGKIYFYRNRNAQAAPFYVYPLPVTAFDGAVEFFPCEVRVAAGNEAFWDEVELDEAGASVLYTAAEQDEDFGSAQSTITVRASQQRVVGGIAVDGQVTEVTFP